MKVQLLLVALLVAVVKGGPSLKLPSYFGKPCAASLPEEELSNCAENAANQGIPTLTKGDRKLKIPSMRPLKVPKVAMAQGTNQVGLNLTWEPLELHGFPDAKVSNMKISWKRKTAAFDAFLPSFTLAGPYKATGRILLLPMTGSGPSNFTFSNLKLHYVFNWPLKKGADGKEYATLQNSKVSIVSAGGLKSELKGLFNGDRLLGNQMNVFLNENWNDVVRELGPSMIEAAVQVVEQVIHGLIDNVPANELFVL